jgi:putative transcriptional regulator
VTFHLLLKIIKQVVGSPASTLVPIFFILLAVLLGMPLIGAAFSAQPVAVQFFQSPAASPPSSPSQSQSALARGKFLVASRRLGDPNFAETVVLLIEYGQNGTMGVVINRPIEARLSTLLPDVKGLQQRTDSVYLGGPVGQNQMLILARSRSQPEGALRVFEDVYTISGRTGLQKILDESGPDAKFRAYLGYAGWARGQLEMEIAQGGWHVLQADAATVFDKAATEMWPELIRHGEAQWVMDRKNRWPLLSERNDPQIFTRGTTWEHLLAKFR